MANIGNLTANIDFNVDGSNLENSSKLLKELEQRVANIELLTQELNGAWKNASKNIAEASKEANKQKRAILEQQKAMQKMVAGLDKGFGGKIFSMMTNKFSAIAGGMELLGNAISDNILTAAKFEQSLANLSSITKATGSDLEFYKDKAIELGRYTTQTASQVAEAFTIIGQKSPLLLGAKEALAEVTEQSIILAQAAGIDVPLAATALTNIMNQFGMVSSQSLQIVDLLASGSRNGAGDIQYLSTAMVQCGSVAKQLGVSANETVAILEELAQGGFQPGQAGRQFKNMLLMMETKQSADELKPSVVGVQKAFENLAKSGLASDTNWMKKVFGRENIAGAQYIANHTEHLAEMIKKVGDSAGEAMAMSDTRTSTFEGSVTKLKSAWEGLNLSINSSNGILKTMVDWATSAVNGITNLINAAAKRRKDLEELDKIVHPEKYKNQEKTPSVDENSTASRYKKALAAAQNYNREVRDDELKTHKFASNLAQERLQMSHHAAKVAKHEAHVAYTEAKKQLDEYEAYVKKHKNDTSTTTTFNGDTYLQTATDWVHSAEGEKYAAMIQQAKDDMQKAKAEWNTYDADVKKFKLELTNSGKLDEALYDSLTTGTKTPKAAKVKDVYKPFHDIEKSLANQLDSLQELYVKGIISGEEWAEEVQSTWQNAYHSLLKLDWNGAFKNYREAWDLLRKAGEENQNAIDYRELTKKIEKEGEDLLNKQKTLSEEIVKAQQKAADKAAKINWFGKAEERAEKLGIKFRKELKNLTDYDETAPGFTDLLSSESLDNVDLLKGIRENIQKRKKEVLDEAWTLRDLIADILSKSGSTVDLNQIGSLDQLISFMGDGNFQLNPEIDKDGKAREALNEFRQQLEQLKLTMDQLGISSEQIAPKIQEATDRANRFDTIQKAASGISLSFSSASSAVASFGQESKAAALAAQGFSIAAAIAQLVALFAAIPKGAEIWSWIAGTVAGVASLVTAIAQIRKATAGSYATGGIVPGNSYVGDRLAANVNSGEMIINRAQQAKLWNIINGQSGSGNSGGGLAGQVEFHISGSELVGTLNNYSRRQSRI